MNLMRKLVLCAVAVVPACAAAPATSTLAVRASDPGPVAVAASDDGVYHPPYSMMFREGQSWTMPVVQLAMTEPRPDLGGEVTCTVEHVDQFCDRRISNITCEGAGGKLLAGAYSATLDGLWKADFADHSTELDDHTMMIARVAPFARTSAKVDDSGDVVATIDTHPWGAAWCVNERGSETHKTICIQPGKGLIGGRDGDVVVGDVPRNN
jgi:hypothetical protein